MLYSDYLKTQKVSEALQKAGVNEIPSPFEDHAIPGDEPIKELIPQIIDREILNRRLSVEHEGKMKEYKRKYAKELHIEEKVKAIRPYVQQLLSGKIREPFDTLENGCVALVSEYCAKHFDFEPEGEESKHEDFSGLNELQLLLKRSGIVRLNHKMSFEELALRGLNSCEIAKWLK